MFEEKETMDETTKDKQPAETDEPIKRPKVSGKTDPTSVMTWNVNGFTSRCSKDCKELRKLMDDTNCPDVVCLQEVRLKASSSSNRGVPMESELKGGVQDMLHSVFRDYTKAYWSLADSRYSGTLTLLHKRLDFHGLKAFTSESAISMLAKHLGVTREKAGLPLEKSNPEKAEKKKQQPSMKSFFKVAPKKTQTTSLKEVHNVEGRFQFFCFENLDLVQTYVPNNGMKHDSVQRRRDWDAAMLQFFQYRQQLLQYVGQEERPILWCGDLNCALTHMDGSHWECTESGEIREYWTDEEKALSKTAKRDEGRHPDDMGSPGFTRNERLRLAAIIKEAQLSDVWRENYPEGDKRRAVTDNWAAPNYTWRGHIGTNPNFRGKYEGKGQRLDYFLLTSRLMSSIDRCDILGFGADLNGFCGSDHSPTILDFKEEVWANPDKSSPRSVTGCVVGT